MKVLSLFDGISCGRVALQRAGIPVTFYGASEIDKHALTIGRANHPDIFQFGDVKRVREFVESGLFGHIDLLIGGSPCQGFSFAGKQLAFDDPRSVLFFEYVAILNALRKVNPNIKFMLENVKMKKEHIAVITRALGVEPVVINSALVSAQNRVRYYWCNWKVSQPADRGLYLRDIIESGEVDREKSYCIDANYFKGGSLDNYLKKSRRQIVLSPEKITGGRVVGRKINPDTGKRDDYSDELTAQQRLELREDGKAGCITTVGKDSVLTNGITYRKLTPVECERLQTLPDGYTAHVSNTQRYRSLGNAWTVDVVAHILSEMPR